jgi:hypothetical protein
MQAPASASARKRRVRLRCGRLASLCTAVCTALLCAALWAFTVTRCGSIDRYGWWYRARPLRSVPSLSASSPSFQHMFYSAHSARNSPVLLEHLMDGWPAAQQWSPSFFAGPMWNGTTVEVASYPQYVFLSLRS